MIRLITILILLCFEAHAQVQYRGFMLGDARLQNLEDAVAVGANIFRYQIHIPHMNQDNRDLVLSQMFANLDPVVDFCIKKNIKLVVDLHNPPGGLKWIEGNKYDSAHFWDRKLQNLVIFTWKAIAARYRNVKLYGYDLLNEPAYRGNKCTHCYSLNGIYARLAKEIRKIDTKNHLILEPAFGKTSTLKSLKPLNDPKIIYSIHWYAPMQITHQTLYNFPELIRYPNTEYDRMKLKAMTKSLRNFQQKHNAKIYIGEFSCIRWAKDGSAKRYVNDMIWIFERFGWDWTYHAWREWEGWSPEHSSDINDKEPKDSAPVLDVLRKWFSKN